MSESLGVKNLLTKSVVNTRHSLRNLILKIFGNVSSLQLVILNFWAYFAYSYFLNELQLLERSPFQTAYFCQKKKTYTKSYPDSKRASLNTFLNPLSAFKATNIEKYSKSHYISPWRNIKYIICNKNSDSDTLLFMLCCHWDVFALKKLVKWTCL